MRRDWGIRNIYLLSGDNEQATRSFAAALGMDDYRAGVLPEEKAEFVRQLQSEGHRVGMVGDGINDSVTLLQADCSFSLRGAADIATDVADIVFMDGSLSKLERTFEISKHLMDNVKGSMD